MTPWARARWGAVVALGAAALLPSLGAHWERARGTRVLAARDATAAAGYLATVTPVARSGGEYDLPQLLIRARALAGLPGLAGGFGGLRPTPPPGAGPGPPPPPAAPPTRPAGGAGGRSRGGGRAPPV